MKHYRIMNSASRFVGGEFCEVSHAYEWAMLHVGGFFVIVQTDSFGNRL